MSWECPRCDNLAFGPVCVGCDLICGSVECSVLRRAKLVDLDEQVRLLEIPEERDVGFLYKCWDCGCTSRHAADSPSEVDVLCKHCHIADKDELRPTCRDAIEEGA